MRQEARRYPGTAKAQGKLKAHVWFWLETAYDSATLRAWAEAEALPIDLSVFSPVQLHFTANPILEEGATDPVPVRSGLSAYEGGIGAVPLVIDVAALNVRLPAVRDENRELLAPLDDDCAVERAKAYLRDEAPSAIEGRHGDDCTIKVANRLGDLGISEAKALDLLLEHWNDRCSPPWDPYDLERKVASAYRSRQNRLGVEHPAHLFANVLVDKTPLAGATTGGHVPGDLSLISGDRKGIRELWAKPFVWRDPKGIPPRRWLYQPHFIRGYVTVTVAVGGAGKTALTMCEGLSVAAGKPLLRIEPSERARVWMWNGEDPGEEGEKRVHAALIQHGLNARDIEGWLSTGSGRDAELVIAEQGRDGARVSAPEVDALIAMILEREIGLVVIDPFVSSHRVPENDNGGIDRVVKAWARIAQETGCAVHLVHHVRKTNGHEATVEDGRGASALHAAARHVRVLNVMGEVEAARVGVDQMKRRSYVRIDDGKTNLTPPAAAAEWFRLVGVELGNGDNVQTVVRWTPPDPFQALLPEDLQRVQDAIARGYGETAEGWRENVQAGDRWAGHAVAGALGFDVSQAHDHSQVKEVIREMIASGLLVKVTRPINGKGKTAPFIEVGRRGLTPHLGQVGGGKVEKVAETA